MSSCPDAPVFWFTGLSGAGKTAVAVAARDRLAGSGVRARIIDGDEVRRRRRTPLGFSRRDVLTNNGEIAALCLIERARADVVFVPIIAPYEAGRAAARATVGEGFHEIYFCADEGAVAARDVKGMYARAARGEIPAMIGTAPSAPYEPPADPQLILDSATETLEVSTERLVRFVRRVLS